VIPGSNRLQFIPYDGFCLSLTGGPVVWSPLLIKQNLATPLHLSKIAKKEMLKNSW